MGQEEQGSVNASQSGRHRVAVQASEAGFSTSFVSQSVRGEIKPEEELPNWVYLLVCFAYLTVVACSAIFIDDLTLIFGIIAGLAECTTVFILPSIFYLVACRQEATLHEAYQTALSTGSPLPKRPRSKKGGSRVAIFFVYLYLICGCVYFSFSNYFNFAKIFR